MTKLFCSLTLCVACFSSTSWAGFAEIGFCPLGGPPGWFNRFTGQHKSNYYPSPVYYGNRYPVRGYGNYRYAPYDTFYYVPRAFPYAPAMQNYQ